MKGKTLEYKKLDMYGFKGACALINVDDKIFWRVRVMHNEISNNYDFEYPKEQFENVDHLEFWLAITNPFP